MPGFLGIGKGLPCGNRFFSQIRKDVFLPGNKLLLGGDLNGNHDLHGLKVPFSILKLHHQMVHVPLPC